MGNQIQTRRAFIFKGGLAAASVVLPFPIVAFSKLQPMTNHEIYDVIIIGGSFAGLSAAMALGRSLRKVLIIDSGKPCNIQTPHSHNFLTHDGMPPKDIAEQGKKQVLKYETVSFLEGLAVKGQKEEGFFSVEIQTGERFLGKKILFASGVKDILPEILGLSECWGISVLHCPYCHGYEVSNTTIGLIGNGELGFELSRLISNWTKDLILFTNGKSTLTEDQTSKLMSHNIRIYEQEISHLEHVNGYVKQVVFKDKIAMPLKAIFARGSFIQNSKIPVELGCELTELGFLKIDDFHRTNITGVYAAGDNTTMFRSVANAVASGNKAGAIINKELIDEEF